MKALLAAPGLAPVLGALPQARIVGGAVRDALAGLPVADFDLATPEPPERVMALLEQAGIGCIPTGLAHGTVTARSLGRSFEITTLRRDVATDGRHAEVAWTADWREDAARRDFTINAMSVDQTGALHDYFGGAADLAAGRVRFVGEAGLRIREDYLRSLRFFRFFARYGRGAADTQAAAGIAANLDGLERLSAERVWGELKKILAAPAPAGACALMAELGVLARLLPGGARPELLARLVAAGMGEDVLLRFAALAGGDVAELALRLKLSHAEAERLAAWRGAEVPQPQAEDAALRRALAETEASVLVGASWLASGVGPDWDGLRARLAAMPRPQFPLEGRDALALGAQPGPAIGAALRALRAEWLQAGCVAEAGELRAALKQRLGLG